MSYHPLNKSIDDSITLTLRGTKTRCDLSLEQDLWPVEVDEEQMSRAIHNIVVNAVQTMPDGGILTVKAFNAPREGSPSLLLTPGKYVGTVCRLYLLASDKKFLPFSREEIKLASGCGNILLMDDEPLVQETVKAMLAHLGYHVECAANGKEAVNMYRRNFEENNPYDVVIMDLTIPGGIAAQEAIKMLLEIDPRRLSENRHFVQNRGISEKQAQPYV